MEKELGGSDANSLISAHAPREEVSNDTSSNIKVVKSCPLLIHPHSLSCTVQDGILRVCLKRVRAASITTKYLAASKLRRTQERACWCVLIHLGLRSAGLPAVCTAYRWPGGSARTLTCLHVTDFAALRREVGTAAPLTNPAQAEMRVPDVLL
jgi:hypothetical protein